MTTTEPAVIHADQSAAFLLEGYGFGRRRFEEHGTDAVRTRLMGRPVTLLRGLDAAAFFYADDRFTRVGAVPTSVVHSLQDEGSVQALDGGPHKERKALFLDALDHQSRATLASEFSRSWKRAWPTWQSTGPVSLLEGSARVLTEASLRWAGVSAPDADVDRRTREFRAMIDGAGSFGPRNWRGRMLRLRTERWARALIRDERLLTDAGAVSPLARVARHRDGDGLLDEATAAVELLNLLRPTVAISHFIAFAGLALHLNPDWRDRVAADDALLLPFCQEVRRAAPFFPAIAGRATEACRWGSVTFEPGDWVVLDLFATDRDPARWTDPDTFDPARFIGMEREAPIVPQGAGAMATGHRCPGEPATVDLLAVATRILARSQWTVPRQDLGVDLRRLPALPGSKGFLIQPTD
ncbi:cytochrome P450 [Microbacterium sp. NPDC019599]|uniref:cytochrome P450 n=1 Tax=Microbacterium sp. NPDC019599 TaxID=3154690 RepID=UPI0033F0A4A7